MKVSHLPLDGYGGYPAATIIRKDSVFQESFKKPIGQCAVVNHVKHGG